MKRKKNVINVSAVSLTLVAMFAGRVSTKFANAVSLYVSTGISGCRHITILAPSNTFTTIGFGLIQASIKTANNTASRRLWSVACNGKFARRVYFHP